jgi:hypothetical protein
MKSLLIQHIRICLMCIFGVLNLSACNSPSTSVNADYKTPIVKTIDKSSILSLVADLSGCMAAKPKVVEVNKVLKSYDEKYKLNITGFGLNNPIKGFGKPFNRGKEYASVYVEKYEKDTTRVNLCEIQLPETLQNQLTFNDLKNKFGDWKKVPANLRPLNDRYILTSFNNKDAPGVSISVDSKNLPDYKDNKIYRIRISFALL